MIFLPSKWLRADSVSADLLTWEWTTTYDQLPSERELQESFALDFPKTFPQNKVWLLPLLSFNSPEGRRYRYLVVLRKKATLEDGKAVQRRELPEQIWLYGYADEVLRKNDWDGNALFYRVEGGALSILAFQKGLLCFWVEESGYTHAELVEKRLKCFKEFLKEDGFMNRCDDYHWACIESENFKSPLNVLKRKFFCRAAQDPFWKKQNFSFYGQSLEELHFVENNEGKVRLPKKIMVLVVVLIALWYGLRNSEFESVPPRVFDADPPELLPPEIVEKTEPRELFEVTNVTNAVSKKQSPCDASLLKINGIVANKLFLSGGKMFLPGDSLGPFKVVDIARNQVHFVCEDSRYVGEARR